MKTIRLILACLLLIFTAVSSAHAKTAEEWYDQAFEQSLNAQYQKAVRSYRQALRLKKDWALAHHGLGIMYFNLKDGVKAAHHLRQAEKFYHLEDDINLSIIRRNLEKTYSTFNLHPEEFQELETLHPPEQEKTWVASGNGFLIGGKGYLFTLLHNLGEEDGVRVRFANQLVFKAKVVKRFIIYDLALLKLDVESPPPGLMFGDSSKLRVEDTIWFPDTKEQGDALTGKLTALRAIMNDKNMFELDLNGKEAEATPLMNAENQVVGIILSSPEIVKNFQAAGRAPKGEIALKSSYLNRVFSLYLNSLEGPQRRNARNDPVIRETKSGGLVSSLATVEIQK